MEFWPENQTQSALYAKFGTIPGRNCSHNYHDRHQAAHYPLYYAQQQDQGRESSYWTGPGPRTEGALEEYTAWMDPELSAPTSSHFPFILDRHTQQHQDRGEYHSHEARDREWTAAQRTAKDYERGLLREAWQRRWEPCGPARYNREAPTKRSDSSYRELEAWAARYCHSLPRRRRLEAELRGASQGLLDSSRTGTDPRAAALQQLRQSANVRESGAWDTGGRMQTPTYYQPQATSHDTSRTLDIREKTGAQRRMFSQPPGYAAPPPYSNPHKSTPTANHCVTGWEQEGRRQAYWPQATLRKDVSEELQYERKGEKEDLTKPDDSRTCAELDGIKHRRQETEASKVASPVQGHATTMQHENTFSLRQKQTLNEAPNTNKQTSSKIIEGRKFRLNKKTGGMTVFCLVSRIAGVTETPSLPLCISQTNVQNVAVEEASKVSQDGNDHQSNLADEVDFKVSEKTNTDVTNTKQSETQAHAGSEMLKDNPSNTEETGNVVPERENLTDANSSFGKESKQPVSVKYPLWREPGSTSRAEAGASSASCLKVQSEDGRSDGPLSQEQRAHAPPNDPEAKRLDVKDPESEGGKGLWVIDTSCVVVKMELIPSPKKDHVHYVANKAEPDSPESNNQVTTTDRNAERTCLQTNDGPAADPHSDPTEERAPSHSDVSSLCMSTSSVSETLEERAQRILGIPLYDCITEQQPGEEQDEEAEPSPGTLPEAAGFIPEETTGEEPSQNHLEVGQTEDAVHLDNEDAEDQGTNENDREFVGSQDQPCVTSEENETDFQLETEESKMTEGDQLEPASGRGEPEQLVESDSPAPHSSSPEDLADSAGLTHSNLPVLSYASDSNEDDSELAALVEAETPTFPHTPLDLASPLPPESTESSPASTPCTDHSPGLPPPPPPPPLHLIDESLEATPPVTLCRYEEEPSQLVENTFNGALEDFAKDMTSVQPGNEQPDDPTCAEESSTSSEQQSEEAEPRRALEQSYEISDEHIQSLMTEEQTQRESPTVFLEVTTDQENREKEREEHCDNAEEQDACCVKENYETEEQSQTDAGDDPAECSAQNISQANVTDPQTDPSGLDSDVPSRSEPPSPSGLSHIADTEPVSLIPDPAVPESVPAPDLDQIKEFSSSLLPDSPSNPPLSLAPPSQQADESVSLDLPHKDEPQYPTSLWDAVNRIRKHTAPDSENEEEEVSEPWDPESLGEGPGWSGGVEDRNSKKTGCDEVQQQEVSSEGSVEDVDASQIQQDECHEEPRGHTEDDTLSCSSASSHTSGDTVIVAEEDKAQETTLGGGPQSKTDVELHTADGARRRRRGSEDETVDEQDEEERQNGNSEA